MGLVLRVLLVVQAVLQMVVLEARQARRVLLAARARTGLQIRAGYLSATAAVRAAATNLETLAAKVGCMVAAAVVVVVEQAAAMAAMVVKAAS